MYLSDGLIRFMCQKDTQINLRGQRMELAKVKHHTPLVFPSSSELVAKMILPDDENIAPFLIALS